MALPIKYQDDGGEFTCKLYYTPLGSIFLGGEDFSETVQLNIYGILDLSVTDTTVNIGDDVTITCTADNLPNPLFIWYKNGFQFETSSSQQISLDVVSA